MAGTARGFFDWHTRGDRPAHRYDTPLLVHDHRRDVWSRTSLAGRALRMARIRNRVRAKRAWRVVDGLLCHERAHGARTTDPAALAKGPVTICALC